MDDAKNILLRQLAQRVKELRLAKNMTQKDLALACDKDFQSIARLEQSRINPTLYYLMEIAKGLDVDITELVKGFKLK